MIEMFPIKVYLDETQIAYLLSRKEFDEIRFNKDFWQEEYSGSKDKPMEYQCGLTLNHNTCECVLKVLQPTNVDFIDKIIYQIRDKLQADVDMLVDSDLWFPKESRPLEQHYTQEEKEENRDYLVRNLIYSEDTKSYTKRLWEVWKKHFPENKLDVEADAFQILDEMYEEYTNDKKNNDY